MNSLCRHVFYIIASQSYTVEPPITDPPNSGPPPNNGPPLMYQLLFPLTQYIFCSRISDNLRIPNNGQALRTERTLSNTKSPPITDKWAGHVWAELRNIKRGRAFSFASLSAVLTYAVGFWQ